MDTCPPWWCPVSGSWISFERRVVSWWADSAQLLGRWAGPRADCTMRFSSVVKWRQRARTTGSAAARPMGGKRPVLLAGQRAFVLDRIALKPHISIRALQAELAEHGTVASYGAVWTFLHRQGLSHKKKPARSRAGPARRRPQARPLEEASAPD